MFLSIYFPKDTLIPRGRNCGKRRWSLWRSEHPDWFLTSVPGFEKLPSIRPVLCTRPPPPWRSMVIVKCGIDMSHTPRVHTDVPAYICLCPLSHVSPSSPSPLRCVNLTPRPVCQAFYSFSRSSCLFVAPVLNVYASMLSLTWWSPQWRPQVTHCYSLSDFRGEEGLCVFLMLYLISIQTRAMQHIQRKALYLP